MKLPIWPRRAACATVRAAVSVAKTCQKLACAFLAPIGFREVLLLGGSVLLGVGAAAVYPPAAFIAPGVVLVGVAVFGVRA
jgi:hypothetical protein